MTYDEIFDLSYDPATIASCLFPHLASTSGCGPSHLCIYFLWSIKVRERQRGIVYLAGWNKNKKTLPRWLSKKSLPLYAFLYFFSNFAFCFSFYLIYLAFVYVQLLLLYSHKCIVGNPPLKIRTDTKKYLLESANFFILPSHIIDLSIFQTFFYSRLYTLCKNWTICFDCPLHLNSVTASRMRKKRKIKYKIYLLLQKDSWGNGQKVLRLVNVYFWKYIVM